MKAEDVKIRDLKTAHDCTDALVAIETDRRNHVCSLHKWNEGRFTPGLKRVAQLKMEAITRKLYSLPDMEEMK